MVFISNSLRISEVKFILLLLALRSHEKRTIIDVFFQSEVLYSCAACPHLHHNLLFLDISYNCGYAKEITIGLKFLVYFKVNLVDLAI